MLTERQRREAEEKFKKAEERLNEVEILLRDKLKGMGGESIYDLRQERFQLKECLRQLRERRPIGKPVASHNNSHLQKDIVMKIEFENENENPTFGEVGEGQLFVGNDGCLYQKGNNPDDKAWQIVNIAGEPEGSSSTFSDDEEIEKILPKIRRIAF